MATWSTSWRTRQRTARTDTSKATSLVSPARTSARPNVTGPTNCHFTGALRPAAAARNARQPANASCWRSVTTGASGSKRRRVEGDAAVLADGDPGESDQSLGDHPLCRRTLRQCRDRRQLEGGQRELRPQQRRRDEEGCRSLWQCHLVAEHDSPRVTSSATSFHSSTSRRTSRTLPRPDSFWPIERPIGKSWRHALHRVASAGRADRTVGAASLAGSLSQLPGPGRSATRSTVDRQRLRTTVMIGAWLVWGIGVVALGRAFGARTHGHADGQRAVRVERLRLSWIGGAPSGAGRGVRRLRAVIWRPVRRRRRLRSTVRAGLGLRRRAALPAAPAGRLPAAGRRRRAGLGGRRARRATAAGDRSWIAGCSPSRSAVRC